jgi:DNA polymerase
MATTDAAALRLQLEWGADEALADHPIDRFERAKAPTAPMIAAVPPLRASPTAAATPAARAAAIAAAASTVEALYAAVAAFDGCALRDTATNLVFEDGSPEAPIMLIGEAPGADEDRAGRPFAGAGGAYLARLLASIGLDRSGVLLTTLLPWRPPGGRAATDAEIALCLPFLARHVALRAPRILFVLGARTGRALGASPASSGRRRPAAPVAITLAGLARPLACIVSPTLEQTMRDAGARRMMWADLRQLRRLYEQGLMNP